MWAYAVAASISGAVFGLAYRWTGNIWVPVTAHALHNLLSTLLMGKKVDVTWSGWLPQVRIVPEQIDEEEDAEALPEEDVLDEQPAEPIPAADDGESPGTGDGDSDDRPAE
jgi:hypothetical protein